MANSAKRAAKRFKREHRPEKVGTWRCTNGCGERHPNNERCPIPRRDAVVTYPGALDIALVAALTSARGIK
jgi:hypothetical protein